jgi:molybdopterin synthase catalytic subunit
MKIIYIEGEFDPGENAAIAEFIEKISATHPGKTGVIYKSKSKVSPDFRYYSPYSASVHNTGSIVSIKEEDLSGILDLYSDSGILCTILLGFNDLDYKKIIFGDSEGRNCILKKPSADEIIESLEKFDDHYTMQGLVKELKEEVDIPKTGCYLHFNGIVREITGDERTEYMDFSDYDYIDRIIAEIRNDMERVPGILGVRFYHNKGRLYAGDDVTYIAVAASHRQEAFKAMMDAIDRLKADLHNQK